MCMPVSVVDEAPVCVRHWTGEQRKDVGCHQWNVIQLYKEMKF